MLPPAVGGCFFWDVGPFSAAPPPPPSGGRLFLGCGSVASGQWSVSQNLCLSATGTPTVPLPVPLLIQALGIYD